MVDRVKLVSLIKNSIIIQDVLIGANFDIQNKFTKFQAIKLTLLLVVIYIVVKLLVVHILLLLM